MATSGLVPPMRLLFVHKHFPGQFAMLARSFAVLPDAEVVFVTAEANGHDLPGVRRVAVAPTRESRPPTHHYLQYLENAVLLGQAAYRACVELRREGFTPDLIYAHAGFGAGMYVGEAFPGTPVIGHFEWFYRPHDSDADYLPQAAVTDDEALRIRTRNAGLLLELVQCARGLCPTAFQRDQFPAAFHDKLTVIHDGVDTETFVPGTRGRLALDGLSLGPDAEIVTYATRGMEPYRGFPQFMHALALLQRDRPGLHAVIAGDDSVHYGRPRSDGRTWKRAMLDGLPGLDRERVHFTGTLPRDAYRSVLQASSAHVYLTVPFVLSWSLIEAMACGCTIVGADTPPVRELVTDGETGLLVDFREPAALAARIAEALNDRERATALGAAARAYTVQHYDRRAVLPAHFRLAAELTGRDIPLEAGPRPALLARGV